MVLFARRVKRIVLRQKLWPNSPWTNAVLWLAEKRNPLSTKEVFLRSAGERYIRLLGKYCSAERLTIQTKRLGDRVQKNQLNL